MDGGGVTSHTLSKATVPKKVNRDRSPGRFPRLIVTAFCNEAVYEKCSSLLFIVIVLHQLGIVVQFALQEGEQVMLHFKHQRNVGRCLQCR